MAEEIRIKKILWTAIERKFFCPVILAGVIAFLLSELTHLELVGVFSDTEQFYYFFSSAIIQGIIGIAAFTIAAVTLFPPSDPSQHPKSKEEFEWWTKTNLTELAFLSFLMVVISLILPFIGKFLHYYKTYIFFSNWIILAIIFFFTAIVFMAARLIRRTSGYSKEHLD